MARALRLAARGLYTTHPNPRVGCVIVRDGQIVGEGWHVRAGGPHAEVQALNEAGAGARGATVYVTLEPCCHHGRTPPCTEALIGAGVARVVAASRDPNPRVAGQGFARLEAAGIRVENGLLQREAHALNAGFLMRMVRGRPWVRIKLAMSLDGRTALASGESKWITSEEARRDAHRLRARSSAIMTGIATVLEDDPALNVRLEPAPDAWRQPVRVVLDTQLRMPPAARMLQQPGETWILTAADDAAKRAILERAGARVERLPAEAGRVSLRAALERLAELEINELTVEAGATLSGALLEQDLVDEIVIYMAPHLLGDKGRGLFELPELADMTRRVALRIEDIRAIGPDWRITAYVAR